MRVCASKGCFAHISAHISPTRANAQTAGYGPQSEPVSVSSAHGSLTHSLLTAEPSEVACARVCAAVVGGRAPAAAPVRSITERVHTQQSVPSPGPSSRTESQSAVSRQQLVR